MWQRVDSNQKLQRHVRHPMTLILLPTRRSVVDDSNGIGGDKIKAILMVAMKAKTLVWLMVVAVMTMEAVEDT